MTRDPIGVKGGLNLYSMVHNNIINFIDLKGLYTLRDAKRSLINRGVSPDEYVDLESEYSDTQIFEEWLKLEKTRGKWWEKLPPCPRKLCLNKSKTKAENPKKSKWADPYLATEITKEFHPGAMFEMRTLGLLGPRGNQCIYDKDGLIMEGIPAAGSADWFSSNYNVPKHFLHDVDTFNLAKRLSRIKDYYSVREIWVKK